MKNPIHDLIAEATTLTRGGHLREATATIQRALRSAGVTPKGSLVSTSTPDTLVIDLPSPPSKREAPDAGGARGQAATGRSNVSRASTRPGASSAKTEPRGTASAHFKRHTYDGAAGSRDYKLFVPATPGGRPRPLVVMLHGCTQDPDDFAAGTRMNELAQEQGFLVLYPAQAPRSNASKCWNWFMPKDQHRDHGEPALLAGMTRHVVVSEGVDPSRVYVAGLSAGGAMAAILGREYPDLYAAVGIHSGLPQGAAHDVASAFSAMKTGPAEAGASHGIAARHDSSSVPGIAPAPVIVFHGDHDNTVHPSNGSEVITALLGASDAAGGVEATRSHESAIGRSYTRTLYRRQDAASHEPSLAEHWLVHGAGHAWSGGSPRGSFTDARGPDASREMLRFFTEHPLTTRAVPAS